MKNRPKNIDYTFKTKKYASSSGINPNERFHIIKNPVFNPEQLKGFMDLVDAEGKEGSVNSGTNSSDNSVRRSRIVWLADDKYAWIYEKLWAVALEANKKYQFNIRDFRDPIQIAVYDGADQGFYDWHMDFAPHDMTRKISISIPLNDDTEYEGGHLELSHGAGCIDRAPQKAGTVVIFPGFLQHRVLPVTKGKRYSMVVWVGGPQFK